MDSIIWHTSIKHTIQHELKQKFNSFSSPSILSQRMWNPSSLQISKMMPFLGLLSKPISMLLPSWSGGKATGRDPAPPAADGLSFLMIFPGESGPSDVFLPDMLENKWDVNQNTVLLLI